MRITVITVFVAVGALLLSWPQATARDQPSRMLRFLEAADIKSLMEQQWAAQQELARVQVKQMVSRMRSQLPAMPEQQASELDRMMQEMIAALVSPTRWMRCCESMCSPLTGTTWVLNLTRRPRSY
jgi:hypothetical protein